MSSNSVIEPPAILEKPTQIACLSVSNETVTANSISSLQYFKEPPQNASLAQGCQTFLSRYQSDLNLYHPRPLDSIFTVLNSGNKDIFRHADVVTWRGIITKIMLDAEIKLNISFIDGVLYLDEHDSELNKTTLDHYSYPGQAFEAMCTKSTPDELDSTSRTVDPNPHNLWCTIVSRQLGNLRLIVAGEVDCVKGNYTGTPDCFLELKTQRINANRSKWAADSTYKKWYLQSWILGTGEMFVGHRDTNDTLCSTEWIKVDDLVTRVKGWDPKKNIDRGAQVLDCLRKYCNIRQELERDDNKVWRVEVCRGHVGRAGDSVNSGVFVTELKEDERDFVSSRGGKRMGIIPMHAVDGLRSNNFMGL